MVKILKLNSNKSQKLELEKFLKKNFELEIITYSELDLKSSVIIFCDDETTDDRQIENISITQNHEIIKKIVALNGNSRILLNTDSILYFYCENNSVNVVIEGNSVFKVNHALNFWAGRLSEKNFIRCQKGYLVNIEKVVEVIPYFNSTLVLKFKGHDKIVPVGRTFMKQFKNMICW